MLVLRAWLRISGGTIGRGNALHGMRILRSSRSRRRHGRHRRHSRHGRRGAVGILESIQLQKYLARYKMIFKKLSTT